MEGLMVILLIVGFVIVVCFLFKLMNNYEKRLEARIKTSCFMIPYAISLLVFITCYIVYFNTDNAMEYPSFNILAIVSFIVSLVYFIKHIKRYGLKDALFLILVNIIYGVSVVIFIVGLISLINKLFGDNDKKGK